MQFKLINNAEVIITYAEKDKYGCLTYLTGFAKTQNNFARTEMQIMA